MWLIRISFHLAVGGLLLFGVIERAAAQGQPDVARLLRVEWEPGSDKWGPPRLVGHVYNDSTYRIGSVRLRVETLDGVLFTHDHADHTHGIDDLRGIFFMLRRRVDVYLDAQTRGVLMDRFGYCFVQPPGSSYPAILQAHDILPPEPVRIEGAGGPIEAVPIVQDHGDISSLGFRFGNVLYSPDIAGVPESSMPLLQGLDLWIVDALRPMPHPGHFSLKQALQWIERVGAKRAILTHMTMELDYAALKRELPAHIEPAYDGMVVQVP